MNLLDSTDLVILYYLQHDLLTLSHFQSNKTQRNTESKKLVSDSVCHSLIIVLISIYPIRGFSQSLQERASLFIRQIYISHAGKMENIFETN
jgi:hypothetical protein